MCSSIASPPSANSLRLRSGTGTNHKILGKYQKGTEIIVVDKTTSSWYEVTCPDGKHGYMSAEYLTYVRTETYSTQINVGFHNQVIESRQLRDQPFRIYRVVPELDKVTVYCNTLHLTEMEIQQRFLQAFNRLLDDRAFIIADTSAIMERLTATDELESKANGLREEMAVASELIRQAIEQNASMAMN